MITALVCFVLIIAGITAIFILHYNSCSPKGKFKITIYSENLIFKGDNILVSMSYSQKIQVEIAPVDSNGNPARVEAGSVQITSSDESIALVRRNPDNELMFEILGNNEGRTGVAQIDLKADADLGEGVVTIEGFIGTEILPKQAVGFGFVIGEPVEQ